MTPSSVLVVKPSSLGDIVHSLPAIHYLKATFRDAEISWIVNTEWVPLLEKNADLQTVIPFPRGELTPEEIFEFTRLLVPMPVVVVGRSRMHFRTDRNGLSLVNQTDLAELIWLLRQSSFIVSVDSGPMHIAAAITPEILSIHTWSDPGAVGPYNPEAWIWKAKRIYQVRSNRRGQSWKGSEERPDIFQIANFVRARLLH